MKLGTTVWSNLLADHGCPSSCCLSASPTLSPPSPCCSVLDNPSDLLPSLFFLFAPETDVLHVCLLLCFFFFPFKASQLQHSPSPFSLLTFIRRFLSHLLKQLPCHFQSEQSILKEVNPEYSLEGLMLKRKLQSSGHLMGRADSLEKTLMLRKIEGRRRRGRQRVRWLDASPTQWT